MKISDTNTEEDTMEGFVQNYDDELLDPNIVNDIEKLKRKKDKNSDKLDKIRMDYEKANLMERI
jgi:hypothetical protein